VIASFTHKLRALDAFEEVFWLLEQTVPRAPVLVGELEGATTVEAWEDGLRAVQRKYPLLSARITKSPGERPFFAYAADARVPFRVVPLTEHLVIEEEMGRAIDASFGDGSVPLMRVTLFHAPTRCVVLISSHHAVCDGKTNVSVLLDLVAAVAGEDLGPSRPISSGLSALFGLPAAGPYTQALPSSRRAPDDVCASKERIRVERLRLSREETAALVRGARAAKTTVQGALVAALAVAGRHWSPAWRSAPTRYAIAMDVRPMLSILDAPGLLVSAHLGTIEPSPDRSFWDLARTINGELAKSRKREAVLADVLRLRKLMEVEHDPAGFRRTSAMQHELMVTNYGNAQVRTAFGPLKLIALSSGSASGDVDTQKISAITVDGQMMMTLVSPTPFPSLLDDARTILAWTCAA
jgi:hypothetical protein